MFKLVVLCAFFAAAAAKPSALFASPILPLATTYVSPGTTTITNQASSVLHPTPLVYSAPLAYTHFIKKRSAPLSYIAPATYLATSPSLATTYTGPLVHNTPLVHSSYVSTAPIAYTTAHFIKKRSAPLATTYFAPTTYAAAHVPVVTSTYSAGTHLIASSPLISHAITYPTHFIKKRSAPLLNTYVAPTSYSHQSRVDVHSASPIVTSYASPFVYTSPVAVSHVI